MMALLTLATYQAEWREENRTTLYSPGHSNVHTFVFAAIFSTYVSIVKR